MNLKNLSIDNLCHTDNLSVRAYNICKYSGLPNVQAIIEFYSEVKTFIHFRNCGESSNNELIRIAEKYSKFYEENQFLDDTIKEKQKNYAEIKPKKDITEDLTHRQIQILNNFLHYRTNQLSIRPYNAIVKYFQNKLNIKTFYKDFIYYESFDILLIRNVGRNSAKEIEKLIQEVNQFLVSALEVSDEGSLNRIYLYSLLKKEFKIEDNLFSTAINHQENLIIIPLFKIISVLLTNYHLLSPRETLIFTETFPVYVGQSISTLLEVAGNLNLTRERIRQLRNKIAEKLLGRLNFINGIDISNNQYYRLENEAQCWMLQERTVDRINDLEHVNFDKYFYAIVLELILSKKYTLFGPIDFLSGGMNVSTFSKYFFIENKLADIFNFKKFLNDVKKRLENRIPKSYSLALKGYAVEFYKTEDYSMHFEILNVIEMILFEELDIVIREDMNLNFQRNTKLNNKDYVFEAFKNVEKGNFLSIWEIKEEIKNKFPEIHISDTAIRAVLIRENDFISIGKSGTWGLKEWGYSFVQSGTIIELVQTYLSRYDEPKHISEIAQFINKFRKISYTSLLSSLKYDKNNTFLFINSMFFGLNSKKKLYRNIQIKNVNLRKSDLQKIEGLSYEQGISKIAEYYNISKSYAQYKLDLKISKTKIQIANNKLKLNYR